MARVVTPGERVGRVADAEAGVGVYAHEGNLHAAVVGQLRTETRTDGVRDKAKQRALAGAGPSAPAQRPYPRSRVATP